jgi:serine/threonine-protein kinase
MLYQMLTGVLPFRGDSMAELMYKIANEEVPDIRAVRSDISDQLARVVAKALAKRSEDRYQDGDAFAADLRAVLAAMAPGAGAIRTGAGPGYDSGQQLEAGEADAFAKTAAFAVSPAGSGAPSAGDGSTDAEDKKPGHL